MKKHFISFVAATILATIGVAAQTEDRAKLQKRVQLQHEQIINLIKQRTSEQPTQTRTSLKSGEISYTALDYSTIIPTNGSPVQGSFTAQDNSYLDMWDDDVTGKGFSFTAQAGKTYKITCKYEASKKVDMLSGFYILDDDYGVLDFWYNYNYGAEELTVTADYFVGTGSIVHLLLFDYYLNDLNYTITIEETNISLYTALDYSTIIPTNGSPVQGSFTAQDNTVSDWDNNIFTGKGYSFTAQAGKTYKITCEYEALQGIYIDGGFYILDNYYDVLSSQHDNDYGTKLTVTGYFVGSGNTVRLLLYNYDLHDFSYTITVEEINILTLPELLNSTTKTITYSNNMQFTTNGVTTNVVASDIDLNFRGWWNNGIFYAVAYKITLTAGDNIKIHSSKEWDSYLYIYKSDGAGGYMFVEEDDDGYGLHNDDSYLDFTALETGVYYLVVTDHSPETAGPYYLTVWNTPQEPYNDYTNICNIPANLATVYTSGKNIIISNVETSTPVTVADMTGRIITNITAKSSEINIPVSVDGIYIVRVGKQTVKVICKF